jgi:hypothetical protein
MAADFNHGRDNFHKGRSRTIGRVQVIKSLKRFVKQHIWLPAVRWVTRLYISIYNKLYPNYFFTSTVISPDSSETRPPVRNGPLSIKDPDNLLEQPSAIVTDQWAARRPVFYNLEPTLVDAFSRSFTFSRGTPGAETLYDVVYVPAQACLYRPDGTRVDQSCFGRGQINALKGPAPEKLDSFANLATYKRKLIYGGACFETHFGHFLTESFARLWYAVGNGQDPILCHPFRRDHPRQLFLDEFYRSLDFLSQRFITFEQPVFLPEVVLPHPSLTLRSEGYEIHRLLPENVAARLLVHAPKTTAQPLYLSRAKLRKLMYRPANEAQLMEILAEKGYAIAFPERLTLQQQIHLINKHETIIGLMGSALHGVLFDLSPEASRNLVCLAEKVSSAESRVQTYMVIDMIKAVKSTYIFAIDAVQSSDWRARNAGAVLDLETTLRGLRELHLL